MPQVKRYKVEKSSRPRGMSAEKAKIDIAHSHYVGLSDLLKAVKHIEEMGGRAEKFILPKFCIFGLPVEFSNNPEQFEIEVEYEIDSNASD